MRIANRIRELFSSRVRQDYSEIVIYYGKIEIDSRPVALAILFDQDNFRRIKLFMWDNSIGLDEFKQIFNSAFTMLLISTFQNDTIFRFYLKKLTDIKVTILPSGNKITQCMAASPPNNIYIDLGWILPYILKIKRKEITANEFVKIVNDLVSGTGHEVAH
ncbi:hypothetical protein HYT92_00885, partial [Candidatus Pacearchaeota archaeon]|nr:hypothetical protein [Candidatus Pacearchaeota archaeon]